LEKKKLETSQNIYLKHLADAFIQSDQQTLLSSVFSMLKLALNAVTW